MRQMADQLMEIGKEKGLAGRNQALFINSAEGSEKAWIGADDPEAMSAREKRAMFGEMDVVMTGFAGLHGSVILARDSSEKLRSRYPASFLEEAKAQERQIWQIPEAAPAGKSDDPSTCSFSGEEIKGMYLLGEGGVFAGLRNMGELAGVGLEIYIKRIPIKQETIEICNFFDVNPYQMFSAGSCLLLSKNGGRLKSRLAGQGIFSEVIGFTRRNNDMIVINGEERRFLERHYRDALELL